MWFLCKLRETIKIKKLWTPVRPVTLLPLFFFFIYLCVSNTHNKRNMFSIRSNGSYIFNPQLLQIPYWLSRFPCCCYCWFLGKRVKISMNNVNRNWWTFEVAKCHRKRIEYKFPYFFSLSPSLSLFHLKYSRNQLINGRLDKKERKKRVTKLHHSKSFGFQCVNRKVE